MADNQVGVRTRAMTEAHCIDNDVGQQKTPTDPEIVPDQTQHHQVTNNTKNLTVQLTRIDKNRHRETRTVCQRSQ